MSWTRPPLAIEPYVARSEALVELKAETWYDFKPYQINDVLNVWSVQRILNRVAKTDLVEDGLFGRQTEIQVTRYQRNRGISADGVVGPATQKRMIKGWLSQVHGLPLNLLDGQAAAESGNLVTAVNWSKPPGCDCFALQNRLLPKQGTLVFDSQALLDVADLKVQIDKSATIIRNKFLEYYPLPGIQNPKVLSYIDTPAERAWRCAMLHHNYQIGANNYARFSDHVSSYWTSEQGWVTEAEFEFEDGSPVRTPFDWCQNYALGSPQHNDLGNVCIFVEDWATRT